MTMVVRTTRPAAVAAAAVAAIHRLDPNFAVTKVRTYEDALAESLARERLNALVSGGFALERAAAGVARPLRPARIPRHRTDEGDRHPHRARRAARAR